MSGDEQRFPVLFSWLRRMPGAVLFSVVIQAAGALVWATQLDARVSSVERQSVNTVMLNEKFARLDERLEYLKKEIESMHRQTEQINKRLINIH